MITNTEYNAAVAAGQMAESFSMLSEKIQYALNAFDVTGMDALMPPSEELVQANFEKAQQLAGQTIDDNAMQFDAEAVEMQAPLPPFADLNIGQFEVSDVEVDNFSPTPIADANPSSDIQLS